MIWYLILASIFAVLVFLFYIHDKLRSVVTVRIVDEKKYIQHFSAPTEELFELGVLKNVVRHTKYYLFMWISIVGLIVSLVGIWINCNC